ncbi:hypothetical protein HKD37_06G017444 [Glycine soja]
MKHQVAARDTWRVGKGKVKCLAACLVWLFNETERDRTRFWMRMGSTETKGDERDSVTSFSKDASRGRQ